MRSILDEKYLGCKPGLKLVNKKPPSYQLTKLNDCEDTEEGPLPSTWHDDGPEDAKETWQWQAPNLRLPMVQGANAFRL
jgi:hypothetical protein